MLWRFSSSAWEHNTAESFLWQRQGTCGTWRARLLCAEGRPASCHPPPPQVFQEELTKGMKVGSRTQWPAGIRCVAFQLARSQPASVV